MKPFLRSWRSWWAELKPAQKIMPSIWVLLLWTGFGALGGFRLDHLKLGLLILVLSYAGRGGRVLLRFLLPLILTGVVYDSQRFYSDLIRGHIRVAEPYLFDKTYFGIPTADHGVLTPNEWWQLHTHPALDLITGFYYLTFIGMFVLLAAYYRFWVSRSGTARMSASQLAREAPRVMWSFFIVNVVGYTTYYWYPAAPPWYVAAHGLGPADLSVGPNPAGCLRFDQLLGTRFFSEFYGRSADVFGAIPSLHVAYPLQAFWYAWRFGSARVFALTFYLMMCFSAVYLNHHYILDILWGSAYALIVTSAVDWVADRAARREASKISMADLAREAPSP